MHLFLVGLNHKTAPVEIREAVAVQEYDLSNALQELGSIPGVMECLLLTTCNRTEAYVVAEGPEHDLPVREFLCRQVAADLSAELMTHFYHLHDLEAVRHLFAVASGIDSMMLGENQIMAQVKKAYAEAQAAGQTSTIINGLAPVALAVGKRARTETTISRGAFSVGYAAAELAHSIFGELEGRTVFILGAGEMSEATAQRLHENGANSVIVANRTYEKAVELAARFGGHAVNYEEFEHDLERVDIIIASTASPHAVLTADMVEKAMRARHERPLFIVDIAVPRDVAPEVGELNNVYLYNIDDLEAIVSQRSKERSQEVQKVRQIINEETQAFMEWRRLLKIVPLVKNLRENLQQLSAAEWQRAANKFAHLSEEDQRQIQALLESFSNKISHQHITQIKEMMKTNEAEGDLQTLSQVFSFDDEEDASGI